MPLKILYFDVETTGTDPTVNELIEFAGIVVIDGKTIEELEFKCQPVNWEAVEPEALEVTGKTLEDLKGYMLPAEAFKLLSDFFNRHIDKFDKNDKFYPAGHQISFDIDFLQKFFIDYGDKYGTGSYQNWRCLDSRVLANFFIAAGLIQCKDVKLKTLCEVFEIEIEAHDALSDIRATRILIQKMMAWLSKQNT